jgi:hypothetical protein
MQRIWAILFVLAADTGYGQGVLHDGEVIFAVSVKGTSGVSFRGSCLSTGYDGQSKTTTIEGTVPAEFRVVGTSIYLTLQKRSERGQIEVEISKSGALVKKQYTDAPFGVIGLASTMPAGGAPRQTDLEVTGSANFALLTLMSETGDTKQQQVTLPFTKTFFPKEGWIVGLAAQKVRVTRPDPTSPSGAIEVQADGMHGSVHAAIRVNGVILGESESSEPFGIASATIRIP